MLTGGQLHQWLGRGVFLLGLAQIPLGLFVYGSPLTLFVLYAVLVFLFLLAWFGCEYLQERGYFSRAGLRESTGPIAEMVERHSPVQNPGYEPVVAVDYAPLQTPKKSRFSMMSWFGRNRQPSGETTGFRYGDEGGAPSIDTSRAASAQSPAIGGLRPAPHHVPPVPAIPGGYSGSGNLQRYSDNEDHGDVGLHPKPAQDSALRNTLGNRSNPQVPLQVPEPFIPNSSKVPDQYHDHFGPTSPHSQHGMPFGQGYIDMPTSPIGGGYMEDTTGFVPSPVESAPVIPLPARPHRRDRSMDSVTSPLVPPGGSPGGPSTLRQQPARRPDRENEALLAGELPRQLPQQPGDNPNISVQVKLNPDKSVTVRRLHPSPSPPPHLSHLPSLDRKSVV